jgi:hypothetical protein
MKSFHTDYTLAELKAVARKYKEVVKLSFSRLKLHELATELDKHLVHDAKGELKLRKKVGLLSGYHAVAMIHKAKAKEEAEKKAVARMEKKKEKEAMTAGLEYDYFRQPITGKGYKKHK